MTRSSGRIADGKAEVRRERQRSGGARRIYAVRREWLRDLRDWLGSFWDEALEAFKAEVEKPEEDER